MLHFSKWKIGLIIAVLLIGLLNALPNFLPETTRSNLPGIMPSKTLNLGLDLRGGADFRLEVDMEGVRTDRLDQLTEDVALKMRQARIRNSGAAVDGDGVIVRVSDAAEIENAYETLSELITPVGGAGSVGQGVTYAVERVGDATIRITPTEDFLASIERETINKSIGVLRERIDPAGTMELTLARLGDDRILLQVPGMSDPADIAELKEKINQTARLTFHEVPESTPRDMVQAEAGTLPGSKTYMTWSEKSENSTRPPLIVMSRAMLTGDDLQSVNAGPHPTAPGSWVVNFTFNTSAAQVFGDYTARNVGRQFAVALDGELLTSPNINTPIRGGRGYIERFDSETATDLALLINSGALPAKLEVIQERVVGAELGDDAIKAGSMASIVGLIGVGIFMFFAYGFRFGTFANLALLINIILIAAVLSLFQATLTLPGVAGIILTIGMAVDANVLIFERIREERDLGRPPVNAVETGYRLSLAPILDANITTFIAAVVLYFVGTGPVQGFAVTLAVGIVTSVFTAVVVARLITSTWLRTAKPKELPI